MTVVRGDLIEYTSLSDLVSRLEAVYTTQDLTRNWESTEPLAGEYPLSAEIKQLYNMFVSAYPEEHLASCVKWTIENGELAPDALMKASTINNAAASLLDMESQTHYSRIVNTAGVTYTQTVYTAGSTNSRTTHSDGTTYSRSTDSASTTYTNSSNGHNCKQNSMRNSSHSGNNQCSCHTVYSSDNSRTSNSAGTSYSRSTYSSDDTTYSNVSHTNAVTNTQSSNTAGTTYTYQ